MNSAGEHEQEGGGTLKSTLILVPQPEPEQSPDELFVRYADAVFAYACRRVNSIAAAEDISAEVFSIALLDRRRCRQEDPLPWLYGIARRRLAEHHRKLRMRREVPFHLDDHSVEEDVSGQVIATERGHLLRNWVETLPPDQREALLLFYVEGLAVKQIAVAMGRTRFSVNSLLQRARKRIYELGHGYFSDSKEIER